jgi:dTDP-glucose 4,6-dehydratase
MNPMTGTMLVAGGAGFIGSAFVRYVLAHTTCRIVVVDKLTYAGSLDRLGSILNDRRVAFVQADIADRPAMERVFAAHRPAAVMNFAAETHVDRSIDDPRPFVDTNIVGAFVLLETARHFVRALPPMEAALFRFVQISTDEVFGSLDSDGMFVETTAYAPNSPYAASKAAADHLVRSYFRTFGLATLITHSSNNYGPYQFPEKLIPLTIQHAIAGRPLPIYGDGGNVRDWLHVDDHCGGLLLVLQDGQPGEHYNIGGGGERTNLQVVDVLSSILDEFYPPASNPALKGARSYQSLKTFVPDRPGHDRRYAIDSGKIRRELGWTPRHTFEDGLRSTIDWYLSHREWCARVQASRYDGRRLGLA